jgi:hypothetical protein
LCKKTKMNETVTVRIFCSHLGTRSMRTPR